MNIFTPKKHITVRACLLLLTILLTLSACGSTDVPPPTDCETVTYVDALGRNLSLPKHPARVAALLGSYADVWMLAGGEICATANDAWEDFDLSLENAVNIGGAHSPSLELLLSAAPTLVLASASTASNVKMQTVLESAGISVVYFEVNCFDDYLTMLQLCTTLTERPDLYRQNGLELKARIDAVIQAYAESTPTDTERRILLLRASSATVKAKGSNGTILGEMLRDMGCINVADGDNDLLENLSVEAVIRENPYHVFAVTMGSDSDAARASLENMINENPAWNQLEAIHCGRLHVMEKRLFNLKPNARWAEAYQKLYETLQNNR